MYLHVTVWFDWLPHSRARGLVLLSFGTTFWVASETATEQIGGHLRGGCRPWRSQSEEIEETRHSPAKPIRKANLREQSTAIRGIQSTSRVVPGHYNFDKTTDSERDQLKPEPISV